MDKTLNLQICFLFHLFGTSCALSQKMNEKCWTVLGIRCTLFPEQETKKGDEIMYAERDISHKPKTEGRWSWLDVRRRIEQVSDELRRTPRIDLHCPVIIEGFKGEKRITDISLGGVFIECENILRHRLRVGQQLGLFIKLPPQGDPVQAIVRVQNVGKRGIGCEFVGLNPKSREAIEYCFNVFKHTLPIA